MGKRFSTVFTTSMAALAALSTAPSATADTPVAVACSSVGACVSGSNSSTATGAWGVAGESTNGTAVSGMTWTGSGVYGSANNGFAVRGHASGAGVGGYFTANPVGGTAIVASCVSGGNVGT